MGFYAGFVLDIIEALGYLGYLQYLTLGEGQTHRYESLTDGLHCLLL